MKQSDITLLMKGMAPVIAKLIGEAVQPFADRVSELEQVIADLPAPKEVDEAGIVKRAADAAAEAVGPMLDDVRNALEALPEVPELPDVAGVIKEAVDALGDQREQHAVQIQTWMDGVEATLAALPEPVESVPFDPETVRGVLAEEVERAVGALPKPQDGKSVTADDVAPLIDQAVSKAVAGIRVPADGVGLAGAIQDHKGNLVVTLTNGATVDVGRVAGKDADMDALRAEIKQMVDAIPRPQDGVDGFGFEDLDLVEDEKGIVLRFSQGETVKDFALPIVFDRGVFKEDGDYRKGNGVTWGGSYWIAQKDDPGKPDTPDSGWRLAVKKGQNGRDAVR